MKRGVLFLALCLVFGLPAMAATNDQLRQIEQQLDQKQQQQKQLDQVAHEAAKGLDDLRAKLIAATKNLQDKQIEEENLEDKLEQLNRDIDDKNKTARLERARLSLMLSALVEIASRPPETLFLQNGPTVDHIHRSILLRAIVPPLKEQAELAARDLVILMDMKTTYDAQQKLVTAAQQNLEQQRKDLDQMIAARQGFLQQTESQKAEVARHLAALSSQASDLRQLMNKVTPRQALPKMGRGDVALKWPVIGSLRRKFGDHDADGVTSEGITLAAPSGAPVVAPRAGRVVFVGPFRGYGKIMILQHAGGYHSFLAGFGRIDAQMGQDVTAGEPLGVLPVKAGTKPELYFEWRCGEEPMDPLRGMGV